MDILNSGEIFLRIDSDGQRYEHPIQGFSLSYSLNQIPVATCRLNAGISLRTGERAPLHRDAAKSLDEMNIARIVARISGPFDSRARKKWDDVGEVVLFEGRVSGVIPTLSRPSMSVEVTLIHWLGDLAFSAALSEQASHGSHASLRLQAVYRASSAGAGAPSFISDNRMDDLLDPAKLQSDLWGDAIHPAFLALTKQDPLSIETADERCRVVPGDAGNEVLKAALRRFDGAADARKPRSKDYVPLKITTTTNAVADGIRNYVSTVADSSMGGRSLWEKILELAGPLGFSVIPLIDHAMVAPVTSGLRQTYVKKLRLDDVSVMQPERWNVRPIRSSVILSAGMESATAFASAPDSRQAVLDRASLIGGCYVPDDGPDRGLVLVNMTPVWLSQAPAMVNSAAKTTGERGGVPGTAVGKAGKDPALRGDAAGDTPADAIKDASELYRAYARYLYVLESLNHRNLLVVCPTLRTDIAPGSSIELEGPFNEPLFGGKLFGTVVRVAMSGQVSSGRLVMATQLRLSGIRRGPENEQDAFSLDEHPLYSGKQFLGTSLRDDLKFED